MCISVLNGFLEAVKLAVYYGLVWVQIFEFALGLIGLGWVSQMMSLVGSSHSKWTHEQLWCIQTTTAGDVRNLLKSAGLLLKKLPWNY